MGVNCYQVNKNFNISLFFFFEIKLLTDCVRQIYKYLLT